MTILQKKLRNPYVVLILFSFILILYAFLIDSPSAIFGGLWNILSSRGVLITDYIMLGGPGAALVNAALASLLNIGVMLLFRVEPNGAIIMAVWLNTGFALFGKNPFNILPLLIGVWLYSKARKEPFSNFALMALLSATLAPIVSEVALTNLLGGIGGAPGSIISGVLSGIAIGFIFPPVASYVVRIHGGYNLYNMGFAGGLLSTVFVAILFSAGIEIPKSFYWADEHNLPMAILLYLLSVILLLLGFLLAKKENIRPSMQRMARHSGRLATDFYLLFAEVAYINMGVLCAFSTTVVLLIGGDLSGPTIGGILTITGFGCFGKHLRNITPVLLGALLSSWLNQWDFTAPTNMLAILFSTCLAPISGRFGMLWGFIAGFLHVRVVHHTGYLSSGFNLYNNGFAAGFVVMFLLPLINAFRKGREDETHL